MRSFHERTLIKLPIDCHLVGRDHQLRAAVRVLVQSPYKIADGIAQQRTVTGAVSSARKHSQNVVIVVVVAQAALAMKTWHG
jgi:hypothetical protein